MTQLVREELYLGPSQPGSSYKYGPVSNGTVGRRPTLIEPARLKDFGVEELLNGDVKVHETKVVMAPEVVLMDPPKTRRVSEFRMIPRPPAQYLRFEDISAAAFRIQSGMQKTPCTYSRLSKQYGMEIYLKKEHLHYTGSVKERGVLYLLTSLTQEQQRMGVIVATDCNFYMAVAHHAVELKIPMFVIMPSSCSSPRLRIYRDYGPMVISYGRTGRDSQNHACHLTKENGYLYLEEVAVVVSSANMELEVVRQCMDRALVLDNRISKFSVQLGEWPGDMAKLLDVLTREDVRLLDVCHRRHSDKSELFKAKVWFQNRRACTLKSKGSSKAQWQSQSPAHSLQARHHTQAFAPQMQQVLNNGQFPPTFNATGAYGQCGVSYGIQPGGSMGSNPSSNLWEYMPQPGCQNSTGVPAWRQPSVEMQPREQPNGLSGSPDPTDEEYWGD
ncbi:uncharacterized protein LOC134639885 isoform X2 [Pelmatolapia mariae]|uniref:uncharacterized protein LOC134639885 isoform X2 n=1 Tax=Pelmatolapia mariae TaxID=158779 RepID=UPI002FE6A2BB